LKTRIEITESAHRNGETELSELRDIGQPETIAGDASQLGDFSSKQSVVAEACIYCGSRERLSSEHVIPYAWGGTLQVFDGSCEDCRRATSDFENYALNEGAMAAVRKVRGLQSRSRHKNAPDQVDVTFLKKSGESVVETIDIALAPLILGFPWFSFPGKLARNDNIKLSSEGWFVATFGADVSAFLEANDASKMHVEENSKRPVRFAQTIAKIAYGYAWVDGMYDLLDGGADLVQAFMREPEKLGLFVGMKPSPLERFPGLDFRLKYCLEPFGMLVYMEVQPFPDVPAPTYLVVLGSCENARAWREIRKRMGAGFKT
jgi:hypothetical protein